MCPQVPPEVAGLLGEGGGGGASHGARHARHGSRGARLSSEEEEEDEGVSEGSEGMSEEEGSGGTPQRPSWAARGAARSGRRPGLRGSAPAPARVASAPDLRAAAAQQTPSPPAAQLQQPAMPPPSGPGFVTMPGGGLQLHFGAPPPAPAPVAAMFAAAPPAPELQAAQLQLPGAMPAAGQPLLVRVGSETHLIPHQQQQPGPAPGGGGLAGGGSTLGKRMTRIQSEPSFACELVWACTCVGAALACSPGARSPLPRAQAAARLAPPHGRSPSTPGVSRARPLCPPPAAVKDELGGPPGGELGDLMNDRDLFKAFDLGGPVSRRRCCACCGLGGRGMAWRAGHGPGPVVLCSQRPRRGRQGGRGGPRWAQSCSSCSGAAQVPAGAHGPASCPLLPLAHMLTRFRPARAPLPHRSPAPGACQAAAPPGAARPAAATAWVGWTWTPPSYWTLSKTCEGLAS